MRTTAIATALLTFAAFCAGSASAQQVNIKPGLWQLEATVPGKAQGNAMAGYMERMKAQMAKMLSEQRKEIEKTMADLQARGTEFTGNGMRTKECITKENIAKFDLLGKKGPDSCTRKGTPTVGGVNVSMTCTQPKMQVDAAVKFQGDKAYTFESVATLAGPDGKPMTQKTSGSGKWLSSDCGAIKPSSIDE
ncbi:DUF3617 domain-containing protein [Massilia sp. Mn16-1_5]|uniref:DUF3617 domain-containing protein n=1 Tax=Massilia sp. Mn16-1_5 TaxID=2079199 RepID=UPI001444E397|nr:DUF3617 domain-containing protein [Massilia sp. Mn16-1_5]